MDNPFTHATIGFLAVTLFVSACTPEEGEDVTEDVTAICIDGVQYWYAGLGQSQVLAPRIDPETLTFMKCEAKE